VQLQATSSEGWLQRCAVLERLNRPQEARQSFAIAEQIDPSLKHSDRRKAFSSLNLG
jgi:cytochrome c-type biogenesis protein CcmH/NrfG